jgi:hypothetical protein
MYKVPHFPTTNNKPAIPWKIQCKFQNFCIITIKCPIFKTQQNHKVRKGKGNSKWNILAGWGETGEPWKEEECDGGSHRSLAGLTTGEKAVKVKGAGSLFNEKCHKLRKTWE